MKKQINKRGLDLVRHFESLYLEAYWDKTGKVWTIGWGHTGLQHNDKTVYKGRRITKAKADELLAYDMHQFEERVNSLVKVSLTDDQFSALVSFDFNTGGLDKSTLLKLLNKKDYVGASNQFERWIRSGGQVLNGLIRRRRSEKNLFLGKTPYIVEKL